MCLRAYYFFCFIKDCSIIAVGFWTCSSRMLILFFSPSLSPSWLRICWFLLKKFLELICWTIFSCNDIFAFCQHYPLVIGYTITTCVYRCFISSIFIFIIIIYFLRMRYCIHRKDFIFYAKPGRTFVVKWKSYICKKIIFVDFFHFSVPTMFYTI